MDSIYDFSVKSIDGKDIKLSAFSGKLLLIVNTASECGFTDQYQGLETLYRQYQDQGLVILGFPCNQFGGQEPGSNEKIKDFCTGRFGITFPLFEKIHVNGAQAHPLYRHLKMRQKGLLGNRRIMWNFTKFLVDADGKVLKRFPPNVKPEKIEREIRRCLS